jgi:carboxylesterase type B
VPAAAIRFLTDWDFICPARHVAATRRDPSWLYVLSAPSTANAPRHGAVHGSDLRLLFRQEMGMPLGEIGERVGAAMRRYWVRFAVTGDPNEPGLPAWPIYNGAKSRHLDLGEPIGASDARGREACDVFDEKLFGR